MGKGAEGYRDHFQAAVDRIIGYMEAGPGEWERAIYGSVGGAPTQPIRANGKPYRGFNALSLAIEGIAHGYTSPRWLTFNGAKAEGGTVRKGERASWAIYYGKAESKTRTRADGSPETFGFLKTYAVFNASQCDGLASNVDPMRATVNPLDPFEPIEAIVRDHKVDLRRDAITPTPCYVPSLDAILMPPGWVDPVAFYSTLAHELVHWTGPRLGRFRTDAKISRMDSTYAAEELVAELGRVFLAQRTGLALGAHRERNSAAYLAGWCSMLKANPRHLLTVSAASAAAVDYLAPLTDAGEDDDAPAQLAIAA